MDQNSAGIVKAHRFLAREGAAARSREARPLPDSPPSVEEASGCVVLSCSCGTSGRKGMADET